MLSGSLHLIAVPPHVLLNNTVAVSKLAVMLRSSDCIAGRSRRYVRSGPDPDDDAHVGLRSLVAFVVSPIVVGPVMSTTPSLVAHDSLESPAALHVVSIG